MVLMAIPVAGSDVNLDIPSRQTKFVYNDCIPKIGTVVTVDSARVDYSEWLVSCGGESNPNYLLPHQCHLLFRGFYPIACNHAQKNHLLALLIPFHSGFVGKTAALGDYAEQGS